MKILLVFVLVIGVFRMGEARADFGGTAFVIGIVVGIATAEIGHYHLDKKDETEEK